MQLSHPRYEANSGPQRTKHFIGLQDVSLLSCNETKVGVTLMLRNSPLYEISFFVEETVSIDGTRSWSKSGKQNLQLRVNLSF